MTVFTAPKYFHFREFCALTALWIACLFAQLTSALANDCNSPKISLCSNCQVNSSVTVGKNIPCRLWYANKRGVESLEVIARPAHGRVLIEQSPTAEVGGVVVRRRLLYMPADGYVGKDTFAVKLRVRSQYGTGPDPAATNDTVAYDVDVVDHASTAGAQADAPPTQAGADVIADFIEHGQPADAEHHEFNTTIVHVVRLGTDNTVSLTLLTDGHKAFAQEGALGSQFGSARIGCTYRVGTLEGRLKITFECGSFTRVETITTDGKKSCSMSLAYVLKAGHETFDLQDNNGVNAYSKLSARHLGCRISTRAPPSSI